MEALIRELDDAREGHRRRVARVVEWVAGAFVAVLLVGSVVMAWTLANVREAPAVDLEPAHPELGAVEQMLVLAEQEARDGDPDAAVQFLELARSRARRDRDVDGLRRVAEAAMRVGESLMERDHTKPARESWALAKDIYVDLGDQRALDRVRATKALRRNR